MYLDGLKRSWLVFNILIVARATLYSIMTLRFSIQDVWKQLFEFAVGSLSIVVLCVSFVGVIIFLEYSYHMKLVLGNDTLIPAFAMIMLVRELAPAVAAMLLASKQGASIAAEIGAMKTSEQLDAYRLLGLAPVDLFVAPRTIASALSTLALTVISLMVAVLGGWITCVTKLQFTTGMYFQALFAFAKPMDFVLMFIKAFAFGASIPIIAATLGFRCDSGSEGVGMATTNAVVAISIWVIILNFGFTLLFSFVY